MPRADRTNWPRERPSRGSSPGWLDMAHYSSLLQVGRCTLALLGVASLGLVSRAQPQGTVLIQEPVAFRVYQRDRNDRAALPVTLRPGVKDASIVSARLSGLPEGTNSTFAGGKFSGIPIGGPYQLSATVKVS